MASILKVSQLQKPDGSTPTAADLGIDVAGSVVGYKVVYPDTSAVLSSTSYVDVAGASLTYTPKGVGNKLLVLPRLSVAAAISSSGSNYCGITVRTLLDGADVSSARWWVRDDNGGIVENVGFVYPDYEHTISSTADITIQLQAYISGQYGTIAARINTWADYNSSILVLEIAQ
jgi:hypothetical protein